MNGFLPRAWMVSLLLAAPGVALAQDAPPAETPAEVQPAEPATEAKPEEAAKPVEEEKKDEEKKDEAPATEAAPAVEAAPAATAAPAAAAAPAAEVKSVEAKDTSTTETADSSHEEALAVKKKAANQLGAAAPVPPDTGRPWQLFATLEANVGQGSFISDPNVRQTAIGWALVGQGFYKIAPLLDGRLDAVGRISMSQSLTNYSSAGGTLPNEFYLSDLQLGVAGRGLYTVPNAGIVLGASSNIFLPTSKASQAIDRVFRWTLGVNGARAFSEVGPGNLLLTLAEGFSYAFGPASPTLDTNDSPTIVNSCRSSSLDGGNCATNTPAGHWSLSHTLAATYLIENFSASLSLAIANRWAWDLRDHSTISALVAGDNIVVGRSQNATAEAAYSTLTTSSLEVAYQFIPEVGVSLGVSTEQNPFVYREGSPRTVKFPFFNFSGDADNTSQFYLDVNFQY